MTRLFYTGIVVLLVLLIFPGIAWGDDSQEPLQKEGTVPVKITADEISYDYDQKQLTATGAARVEYKDIKIEADRVIIDQDLEMILATGQVHVVKNDDEFTGERFLYCLQTEQGWVSPMNSYINDNQLKGLVKFTTEEAKLKGEEIDAKNVFMTSCDREKPHYHLTAGRVEYYPGKRIILHNVWYWEGSIRLLYLPYLVISLEKENFEVDFGYNQLDGWWLQVGYPYEEDNYYGKITSRWNQYTPDVYGIVNNNRIGDRKYWYQRLTLNNDGPLFYPSLLGLGYRDEASPRPNWLIDNVDVTGQQALNSTGSLYWIKSLHFGAPGLSPYPSLTLDYKANDDLLSNSLGIISNWQYTPDNTLSSTLYLNWQLKQLGTNEEDSNQLESLWTVSKNWGWSNLLFKYDVLRVVSGKFAHNNLLPDVTFTIPKVSWLGDIGVIGQYTYLEKFSSDIPTLSGDRKALSLDKSISLYQSNAYSFSWTNKLQYRNYFTENMTTDFSNFTTGITFSDSITTQLKTSVVLDYTKSDGAPPNLFKEYDPVRDGFTLRNNWNWDTKALQIALSDDYNFNTQYLSPATLSLNWTPNDKGKIGFNTSYDWNIQSLRATNLKVDFKPQDNWILQLEVGYNFSNSLWSQQKLHADITQQLSEKWRMQLKASYDILNNQQNTGGFSEAVVGLIYDWHCRELNFHYDYVKQEYWVNLTFKALPDYQFRILDSGDLLEYYLNEF